MLRPGAPQRRGAGGATMMGIRRGTTRRRDDAPLVRAPRKHASSSSSSSRIYFTCTLLLLVFTPRVDSSWWYIGALGARVICDNIPGLVNKQRQLCQRHPDLMQSIGDGAREWIRECQHHCEVMCCGRGYDTTRVQRVTKCECKFRWCCAVECRDCEDTVDVHTCKPHTQRPD
ncbi:hypothetical protein CRUP_002855 [Coryphaenoides rupestris]|nr:hypothetical protein CRUP_002855 [Coryphaenoides rupestris]